MAAPIILPILSLFKSAGLNQARQALLGASKDFNSLAGTIGKAAGAFGAFQALASAQQFTVQSVELAQRYERNLLALQQVFEGMTPRMKAFTKEVEAYGLSQSQAAQSSVFLGSVLKQYGFSVEESAAQTQRLVKLAQDLAVTYGYDVQEALLAITALFRGEYDPIEKFGVAMKQNEVNARVAAEGLGDLEGAALANAQATARLTMLFERANDSVGAFTRANDTLYASQARLAAITENLQLAFGAPLQQPLAAINNIFADLAQEYGPDVVDVGKAIGSTLGTVAPIAELLGRTVLEVVSVLEQLIEVLNFVITIIGFSLTPAIVAVNGALGILNGLLDVGTAGLGALARAMSGTAVEAETFDDLLRNIGINVGAENTIESLIRRLNSLAELLNRMGGSATVFSNSTHIVELGAISAATAATNLSNKVNALDQALRAGATGTVDATGKLQGLAGVFQRIDDEIAKSKAKQSMEDLGLSAMFIEEALTSPNWKEIFETISAYARLAAIDIRKMLTLSAAVELSNQKAELEKRLNELFDSSEPEKSAEKTAKSFFASLNEEMGKQAARTKLLSKGLSEGLVESILRTEQWESVFKRILDFGPAGLKKLQDNFNNTTDGIKEAADEAKELADKLEKIADAVNSADSILQRLLPKEELPRFQADVRDIFTDLKEQIEDFRESELISEENAKRLAGWADVMQDALMKVAKQRDEIAKQIEETTDRIREVKDFGLTRSDIAKLTEPMSLIAEQVSEYEQEVIDNIASIQEKIQEGVDLKIFDSKAATQLRDLVAATRTALISIARDRQLIADEMKRLQDALQFRTATKEAILAYADVTKILSIATNQLQDGIRKSSKSGTEIIAQTIKSARNARDYRVILIKELEEVEKASASAGDITEGLKKVLADTKLFAQNLDALRSMGLDAKVYQQIVAAGMEVGNKTAQAIIDGGPEVVREINALWKSIGTYSEIAAVTATDTVYDLGGDVIEATIQGLRSKDLELSAEASAIALKMVTAFQTQVGNYKVNLDNMLTSLLAESTRLTDLADQMGRSFAETLRGHIENALKGITIPKPPPVILPPPVVTPPKPEDGAATQPPGGVEVPPALPGPTDIDVRQISGNVDFLIDSANDVARLVAYLNQRIIAANEFAAAALNAGNVAASKSAQATAQDMLATLKNVRSIQYAGQPTVVNINVKTDSTQSLAMVGKTIGRTVTKYVTGGGGIVVSPVG